MSAAFLEAWRAYPGTASASAGSQADAWKAWREEGCEADAGAVMRGVRLYAEAAKRPNAPMVQHFHRWLRRRRWEGLSAPVAREAVVAPVRSRPGPAQTISQAERRHVGAGMRELLAQMRLGAVAGHRGLTSNL